MTTPLSGRQHRLRAHGYMATVASVGASLRELAFEGRDLVVPFDADEVRPGYRGATLAPWPNRVVDGRHRRDGAMLQLPLTEPDRGHALHGLVAWTDFATVDAGDDAVTLEARIEPQTGYPWRVAVRTTFRLAADGLTQTVRATNESATPAPWGTGPHPYLVAGASPLGTWTLELPATRILHVTADRLVPTELRAVDADEPQRFDFRTPRVLGAVEIDHAYTGLVRDARDEASVLLTAPDGGGVRMTWGSDCPWVQIHTADLPGGPTQPGHRAGLAVEPMTCAPDAFNADRYPFGTDLLELEPDASAEARWTIAALA